MVGVFSYNDRGVSFGISVIESSFPAVNPNKDVKEEYDSSTVVIAMHKILKDLTARVQDNAAISQNLQVFGMLISGRLILCLYYYHLLTHLGFTLRVYRMQWVDFFYSVLKTSTPFVLELNLEQSESLFKIFRVLA